MKQVAELLFLYSPDAEADTQVVEETSKESDEKPSKTVEETKPEKTVVEEQLLELAVEVWKYDVQP